MADRRLTLLGLPNLLARGYVEVRAVVPGIEAASLPLSNLKTEEPSEASRLLTVNPTLSQWLFYLAGLPHTFGGIALANVNLFSGGAYRFLGAAGPGVFYQPSAASPSSMVAVTNVSGAVGNVDEPIGFEDALYVGPTATHDPWAARFVFPALAAAPIEGNRRCQFVMSVGLFASGSGATQWYPKLTAELWENGAFVSSIGHVAVTGSATGAQVVIFAFDPALVGDTDKIELRLAATAGSVSGGHTYAKLNALELYYETAATAPDFDSGWIDSRTGALGEEQDGVGPNRKISYFPAAPWTGAQSVAVAIMDDKLIHDPMTPYAGTEVDGVPYAVVTVPEQFTQAGVACGGEALVFERGLRSPPSFRPASEEPGGASVTGQTYGADAFRRIVGEPFDLFCTRLQGLVLQHRLGWVKGKHGAFFIATEPDIAAEFQEFNSGWVTLTDMGGLVKFGRYKADGTMLCTLRLAVEEKL